MEEEEQDHDCFVVEITSTPHTPSTNTVIMVSSVLSLSLSFLCVRQKINGDRGEKLIPTTAKKPSLLCLFFLLVLDIRNKHRGTYFFSVYVFVLIV
jgi:hypothetical protein